MKEFTRRELVRAGLRTGAVVVLAATAPALAAPPDFVLSDESLLASVNPQLRKYAQPLLAWRKGPPLSETYSNIRKQADASLPQARPEMPVAAYTIPVKPGVPAVKVYVINAGGKDRPAILHTHGGGFVLGSARSEIPAKQQMAKDLDCTIVTVEYSLAPEATYAVSVEQNYAALKWLHDNAESLGVDRMKIAVMGESAGGGHAALLAIAARDRGEIPLV